MIKKIKSFLFENKTDKQIILKNSIWLGLSELVFKLSQVIIIILIARIFGTEIFGIYSYFGIIIAILLIFSDIGITQVLIRDYQHIIKNERKNYFFKGLQIKLLFSFIIIILFVIYGKLFIENIFTFQIGFLLLLIGIINSFLEYIKGIFRSLKLSQLEFKIKLTQGILYLFLILIIFLANDIIILLMFNIFILLLVLIYAYLLLLKKEFFKIIDNKLIKISYIEIIKKGYIFSISGILITLYYYIDTIMIKSFIGYEAVGIYNAAYKIVLLAIMPIGIFSNSLFPVLANLYKKNKKEYYKIINYYSKIIFISSIFIFPIFIYFSSDILNILFGNKYIESGKTLELLLISVVFLYLYAIYYIGLQVSGNEKKSLVIFFIATIFNLISNYYIIPVYGIVGAAYTTILTEILLFILIIITFYYLKFKNNEGK